MYFSWVEKKECYPHSFYGKIQGHKSGPRVLRRLTFRHLSLRSETQQEREVIRNRRTGLLAVMPAESRFLRLSSHVILGTGAHWHLSLSLQLFLYRQLFQLFTLTGFLRRGTWIEMGIEPSFPERCLLTTVQAILDWEGWRSDRFTSSSTDDKSMSSPMFHCTRRKSEHGNSMILACSAQGITHAPVSAPEKGIPCNFSHPFSNLRRGTVFWDLNFCHRY